MVVIEPTHGKISRRKKEFCDVSNLEENNLKFWQC